MFRSIPISNKICFDKQLKRNWRIHEQKLYDIKSNLSKHKPDQLTFLEQSKKRNVLEDIKNRQIQRSNHILYKRIQQIINKGISSSIQKIGNKNSYIQQKSIIQSNPSKATFHEPYRKKQSTRIFEENQQLVRRIKQKKSAYNVEKMQKQRKNVEKNICIMSAFKYKDYPLSQTQVNLYMTQDEGKILSTRNKSTDKNKSIFSRQRKSYHRTADKSSRYSTKRRKFQRFEVSRYFHESIKPINFKIFKITTYLNKLKFYVQLVNTMNQLQKYRMEMSDTQANLIMKKYYQDNIQNLAEDVEIDSSSQTCYLNFNKNYKQNQKLQGFQE